MLFTFNQRAQNRGGLFVVRVDADAPYETLLDTEADERFVSRSPDGRWIAYMSDASGAAEIYVRPFADGEPKIVSVNGGDQAVFSRDGLELFYLSGERMYAMPTDRFDEPVPPSPSCCSPGATCSCRGAGTCAPKVTS